MHHITDGDALWQSAIRAALGPAQAPFRLDWYWSSAQEQWAEAWGYARRDIGIAVQLFQLNRAYVVQLLELHPRWWDAALALMNWKGEHETVPLVKIIAMQARHAFDHIAEIQQIRAMAEQSA